MPPDQDNSLDSPTLETATERNSSMHERYQRMRVIKSYYAQPAYCKIVQDLSILSSESLIFRHYL